MSKVVGKVFEVSSGKPIQGADVVLSTSDVNHAIEADVTDANGNFSFDNPAVDDQNAAFYVSADGYGDAVVGTGFTDIGLYRTSYLAISKIPTWLIVVMAFAAVGVIYYFIRKK